MSSVLRANAAPKWTETLQLLCGKPTPRGSLNLKMAVTRLTMLGVCSVKSQSSSSVLEDCSIIVTSKACVALEETCLTIGFIIICTYLTVFILPLNKL